MCAGERSLRAKGLGFCGRRQKKLHYNLTTFKGKRELFNDILYTFAQSKHCYNKNLKTRYEENYKFDDDGPADNRYRPS